MCFNLEEADAIIAAEKASGVKYMVGMMKRQDPAYQYVLPLIKELDDVHLVRVHDLVVITQSMARSMTRSITMTCLRKSAINGGF